MLLVNAEAMSTLRHHHHKSEVCSMDDEGEWSLSPQIQELQKEWETMDVVQSGSEDIEFTDSVLVTDPGVFYFVFTYCPHEGEKYDHEAQRASEFDVGADEPHIVIHGDISFENPHGYASAERFFMMIFSLVLSVTWLINCWIWICRMVQKRKYLLKLHWGALGVMIVCTLEQVFFFMDYDYVNLTGHRSVFLVTVAGILQLTKVGACNIIVLLVSLGYGITQSKIDHGIVVKIRTLTFFLIVSLIGFFLVEAYVVQKHLHNGEVFLVLAAIPYMTAICIFGVWTAQELNNRVDELREKNQNYKLNVYEHLRNGYVLGYCSLLVIGVAYVMHAFVVDSDSSYMLSTYIKALYPIVFILLAWVTMFALSPDKRSALFLRHDELEEEPEYDDKVIGRESVDGKNMTEEKTKGPIEEVKEVEMEEAI